MIRLGGTNDKGYDDAWGCTYTGIDEGTSPWHVKVSHYGASPLRNTVLKDLENSYFSYAEQSLMNDTTIYTDDIEIPDSLAPNANVTHNRYFTKDKLYLAYGEFYEGTATDKGTYITVGENSADNPNDGLRIDINDYCQAGKGEFWLRTPHPADPAKDVVRCVRSSWGYVWSAESRTLYDVVPAFELNLSSVLFGSALPAVEVGGKVDPEDTAGKGAFTLRYKSDNLGSAVFSDDKTKVILKDVPDGTFLVSQGKNLSVAMQLTGNETEVGARALGSDSFAGHEVWLEMTDVDQRITYATRAQYSVNIAPHNGTKVLITSNNGTQTVGSGSPIEDIILEMDTKGTLHQYFDDNFLNQLNAELNDLGLTATRTVKDNEYIVTISGEPTSNVNITLPAPAPKGNQEAPKVTGGIGKTINDTTTAMEYTQFPSTQDWQSCFDGSTNVYFYGIWYVRYQKTPTLEASQYTTVDLIEPTYTISANESSLEFDTKNEGYSTDGLSKTVTITNTGNSAVTLQIPITSQSYDVSLSSAELAPNGTAALTVTPKADLTNGTYEETIEVETTQGTSASIDVSFTVNGALNVSLTPSATEIIEGQSVTLTAHAQGGSGRYTYVWYADDVEDKTLQGNEVTVSPTVTTTYKVVITDTIENKSATATITVAPKNYDLEVPGNFTFDQKHIGYEDVSANRFTIKNIGNVDVTNIKAALTGANADAFTLDTAEMQDTLVPTGTTSFTVKPNADLGGGTYTAQVQITGDTGISKTFEISFTVENHDYEEWKSDETGHWHECNICNEKTEVTAHTYGDWTVTKEATCAEAGSREKACSVCEYKVVETIPVTTDHTFGDWETVTSPDCEKKGSEERVCEVCKLTETREVAPLGHDWEADYTVDKEATCTTEGSKSIHCSRCDAVKDSKVISAAGHTAGDDWKNDENNHWKECTVCETKLEEAAHTFVWVTDKEATATEAGSKHEECTVCGYEKVAVEIPATGGTTESSKPEEKPTESPQTGDNSNIFLWLAVLFISGSGVIDVTVYSRKKRKQAN